MERGQLVERKTFRKLPWQAIRNPKTIETDAGDRIMVDAWFGIVRKSSIVHYIIVMVSVRNSHAV